MGIGNLWKVLVSWMGSLREARNQVCELLCRAYEADDIAQMGQTDERFATAERLRTLKEIGKLCGIKVERVRCHCCHGFLPFHSTFMYCSNACKQRAYRIRHGQGRR